MIEGASLVVRYSLFAKIALAAKSG